MNCPKCGNRLDYDAKFCKYCGESVKNNHSDQYNYNYNYSNQSKPNYDMNSSHEDQYTYNYDYAYDTAKYNYPNTYTTNGDDIYIKEFIGPNYESIKNNKFSFPAFFFGFLYLLYRKVYSYALAYIIILIAAYLFLDENVASMVSLGLSLFAGFKFKSLYNAYVERKVEKIKQQSLDKTTQEILKICRRKGRTSAFAIFLIPILFIISFIALVSYFVIEGEESETPNDTMESMQYEKKVTLKNLSFTVPENLAIAYDTDYYREYFYDNCTYSINVVPDYVNSPVETFINTNILNNLYADELPSQIEEVIINNTPWKKLSITSPIKNETNYVLKINNMFYQISSIERSPDEHDNKCKQKEQELLNSAVISLH